MILNQVIKNLKTWDEFQNKLRDLSKKEKGDAFELLTKLYFKINPVYHFYDEVWLFSEIPQKELDYLNLPTQDLGIDLIAKSGNEYHAIQCKYHSDKTSSVTFKEVSTFISLLESNDKISQGYICSSADLTSRNFNKLKTKPINLIMSDSWQLLEEEFFQQANKLLEGKRTKLVPFKPREHQKKAIKEAEVYFNKENNTRGKLIFPCGAGKSLTGYWLTQKLQSKSTVIAVPSLSLVKQTLEVYLREIVAKGIKVKWLCICSDEGIGRNDDVVYYTENLGVPCQTDPHYIEKWLKVNIDEHKIIFTTYQSGRIIAEISKKLNFTFDVGIFDEAHKTVGSDKKLFSHLLFDENISIDKRIFMTATERFYAGQRDDIFSMDDAEVYGETFAHMTFKEAITCKPPLLTDYKVITIDVKKSEIAQFIQENNLVQLNNKWKKETEARSLASMLALRKAMKKFPIKNAVSFHSSIDKAKRNKELQQYITESYNYEPIDSYTVSGKIPTTKRNDIVQEFAKSPKALITNARCLTEGVDVPNIDCIVFADPRKSKVDIVQALGRALRKKKGKEWGYVILPVIYDEVTEEIDNDSFNEILAIVRGLASNDGRIVEYFRDKNEGSRTDTGKPEQFDFSVFSEYIDEEEITRQLEIRLWDKLAKLNWMPFEEARAYVRNLGLKNSQDWYNYCNSGNKPKNIPSNPYLNYSDSGWISMGDWLGTGRVWGGYREYLPFEEARAYVHDLKLKSTAEWMEYYKSRKKPDYIPTTPRRVYKKEWINWGDWLGTDNIAPQNRVFLPFREARNFVHNLKLNSQKEWTEYYKSGKKPDYIPTTPRRVYKKEWVNWGDWLGTDRIADQNRIYRDFKEVKRFVHNLYLRSQSKWVEYCASGKKPDDIPSNPSKTYKNLGWKDWKDFLGYDNRYHITSDFVSYEECKKFAINANIKTAREWEEFAKSDKRPKNIPSNPYKAYKNRGWKGYKDFLGK